MPAPGSGARPRPRLLSVDPTNSRYFTDGSGRAVYLAGSQTWATLQERRMAATPLFDYEAWLDFLHAHHHNFFRLWTWEHGWGMQFTREEIRYTPYWYRRTGPGVALDGRPRFDLEQPNDYLYARLRERVRMAADAGLYVAVMLFQGFSVDKTRPALNRIGGRNAYLGHPFHPDNNVNGIDGAPDGSGTGHQIHTLDVPAITAYQERYVARVVDTLNDFDNVLWEISNETHAGSVAWQYHMIDFIRTCERSKPKQHLIGMSGSPVRNEDLYASSADWIAVTREPGQPPGATPAPTDGSKIAFADADHIGPSVTDPLWVWRCMLNGYHFVIMDFYMDARAGSPRMPVTHWESIRRTVGFSCLVAGACDLRHMQPAPQLASSGYCLANPGVEYLVYLDEQPQVEIDLTATEAPLTLRWFDLETGSFTSGESVEPGARVTLTADPVSRQIAHARAD